MSSKTKTKRSVKNCRITLFCPRCVKGFDRVLGLISHFNRKNLCAVNSEYYINGGDRDYPKGLTNKSTAEEKENLKKKFGRCYNKKFDVYVIFDKDKRRKSVS